MRSLDIVRNALDGSLGFLHAKRRRAIWRGVEALLVGGRLWLTALGRDMPGPALEKHRIKAADRLLGNAAIQAKLVQIYRAVAAWLMKGLTRPVVLVDWTGCGPDQYLLRAGLPIGGRAILLYGCVVTKKHLCNRAVHEQFLNTLAVILPKHCRPIVVTDAGFHFHWFDHVSKLGWDFVGRRRGLCHARFARGAVPLEALRQRAGRHPKDFGFGLVGLQRGGYECRLVLAPKQKPKGRKRRTQRGALGRRKDDLRCSRAAKEPWLLATSLTCAAKNVVAIYATRMQLEESFRDLKNPRFGWCFRSARSKNPRRLELLLLIASMASLATLIVGAAGEREGLARQYQANTVRNRRVLSLLTLGRRIINSALQLPDAILRIALVKLRHALRREALAALPL